MVRIVFIVIATASWQWSTLPMGQSCMSKTAPTAKMKSKCCCGDSSKCNCCCKNKNDDDSESTSNEDNYQSCNCSPSAIPVATQTQIQWRRSLDETSSVSTVVEKIVSDEPVLDAVQVYTHGPPPYLLSLQTTILLI